MKRRALILMLALVMVLGMLPVTAFAASDMETSDDCVDVIKYFEGFSKYPYWDYSQYTVGYGTRCPDDKLEEYMENGITKSEAEALLQKELRSTETTLNKFNDKYDLNLSQHQFDALVSFTYNVGGNWTTGTTQLFTKAVINGDKGNDFIFAMTLWSNAGGSMNLGLVKRRLIEANMYLNGEYDTDVPANYDYVTFNHAKSTYNGSTQNYRVQGYDSSLTDYVRPVGKKDGYRFLGWYTKSTGGEWITTLDSSTAGKTLYVHWQDGEGKVDSSGDILGTDADYVRTASKGLKVYDQPSVEAKVTGSVARGTRMTIVADYVDADGIKWGRLEKGGWVCLAEADPDEPETETPADPTEPTDPPAEEKVIATGTVKLSSGSLNVRKGPGTSYDKVGTVSNGDRVEIYEMKTVSGVQWGRIAKGWISMEFVVLDKTEEEPKPTEPEETETPIASGTVKISSGSLNVRKGPGTSYDKVGSVSNGDRVNVYETSTVSGTKWGRIDGGWVNLNYVVLDGTGEEEPEASETVIAAGTVSISSGSLNIRKGPGTSYDKAGTIADGKRVEIYEIKTVSGTRWGRMSKGWINMNYLKMASSGIITYDGLNIRSGAGTSYSKVGTYDKGEIVFVYSTKKVGSATWGRTAEGWVNAAYVKAPSVGTITRSTLNVRSGAGSGYKVVATYAKGDSVNIYETKKVGTVTWGRSELGWMSMAYVQLSNAGSSTDSVVRTGTVTASGNLNVRKGAGTSYDKVGTVKSGDKLTITALKLVGSSAWGRISAGWVCLDHVELNAPGAGAPALIMGDDLNIRKGAGKSYAVVDQYEKGTAVTILQTKTVSGTKWGRTDKGWVSMDFVL